MFSHILNRLGFKKNPFQFKTSAKILARSQHSISRSAISPYALKVLYRLHNAGYQAYLVGGGIRDVLLGAHPKDFDIATNAKPEEVSELFRNSRLIGRRFRLVHVHFSGHIVEVATFRAAATASKTKHGKLLDRDAARHLAEDGMILRDNIYGTLEEDVWRRDFTINALYYNISDFSLIDYVGGLEDLKNKVVRMIGNPIERYREDPLRMLRAIRFAAKLDFNIEKETEKPLLELKSLISNVPAARLLDEYGKLFLSGHALKSFHLLRKYALFSALFPTVEPWLALPGSDTKRWLAFLELALKNTDERVKENKPVAMAFLLSVFLWVSLYEKFKEKLNEIPSRFFALQEAGEEILKTQRDHFALPRKLTQMMREIWVLQLRMIHLTRGRVQQIYHHPRFRAAYDFLLLRAEVNESEEAVHYAKWWKEFVDASPEKKDLLINALKSGGRKRPRKRRH